MTRSVNPTPRRWASVHEGATHAKVHARTITRMIERGELTGYRFGGKLLRIDLAELDAAMRPIQTGHIA